MNSNLVIDRDKENKIDTAEENTTPVTMSLTDFIIKQSKTALEPVKVNIGGDYKDYDFLIKPVDLTQITTAKSDATKWVKMKKRDYRERLKDDDFLIAIVLESCIEPNFSDYNFIKQLGVITPEEAIKKTFPKAGQILKLVDKIMEISELDEPEELEEQAKN